MNGRNNPSHFDLAVSLIATKQTASVLRRRRFRLRRLRQRVTLLEQVHVDGVPEFVLVCRVAGILKVDDNPPMDILKRVAHPEVSVDEICRTGDIPHHGERVVPRQGTKREMSQTQSVALWSWALVVSSIGLIVAWTLAVGGRKKMRDTQRWRKVLEDPHEIILRVTAHEVMRDRGGATRRSDYAFAVPGTSDEIQRSVHHPRCEPLFVDHTQQYVLGLQNPKYADAVMVVRRDLDALDLDLELIDEVCARARQRLGAETSGA